MAEIAARDDWRFYFDAGYLAAVSPVGVEGEDERVSHDWIICRDCCEAWPYDERAERSCECDEDHTFIVREVAVASPSSSTGPTDDEIERVAKALIKELGGEDATDDPPCALCGQTLEVATGDCAVCVARAALTAARGRNSDDG